MLIAEYSYEKDIEVKQKEAWQEGKQEAEERMALVVPSATCCLAHTSGSCP